MAVSYDTINASIQQDPVLFEQLFNNLVFTPGVTYSGIHSGDKTTGTVQVLNLVTKAVNTTGSGIYTAPDRSASAGNTETAVVEINLDKPIYQPRPLPKVAENATEFSLQSGAARQNEQEVLQAWELGLATALVASDATPLGVTALVTADTIDASIITNQSALEDLTVKPDVIIATPIIYNTLVADKSRFTPATNEQVQATGVIGFWNGMVLKKYQGLGNGANGFAVQYVMYDKNTLSSVMNFRGSTLSPLNFAVDEMETGVNYGVKVLDAVRVQVVTLDA